MKPCVKCEIEKPLESFFRCAARRDGRKTECKDCTKARKRDHYARNKEKVDAYMKRWKSENPDRIAAHRAAGAARQNEKRRLKPKKVRNRMPAEIKAAKQRERHARWRAKNAAHLVLPVI